MTTKRLFWILPLLAAFLVFSLVLVPLYGNFFPAHVSFLLSMRYYAGNWAYNIWLMRKGSAHKFGKLTKASGTFREQMSKLLKDETAVDVAATLALASRFMHFEGRPLLEALPRAVDDIDAYEWLEGELVTGMVLGWNFGDGHLGNTSLLEAVHGALGALIDLKYLVGLRPDAPGALLSVPPPADPVADLAVSRTTTP